MNANRMPHQRGQALVLACVFLLVLALTVALSFSVGNAVHERIRLQAHSDSMAYSLAVLEARSLNTMAHTNRALGASLVGQMTLHAYKAIGVHLVKQLDTSAAAFDYFYNVEMGKSSDPNACDIAIHCTHAEQAAKIAAKYRAEAAKVQARVDAAQKPWEQAIADLQKMTDNIAKEQQNTVGWALQQMESGPVLAALHAKNAPFASEGNPLGSMSRGVFSCAFEGLPSDTACKPMHSSPPLEDIADVKTRDQAMGGVSMAARPNFTQGSLGSAQHLAAHEYSNGPMPGDLIDFPPKMQEIQGGEDAWQYTITNAEGRSAGPNDSDANPEFGTYEVSAKLEGELFVAWGNYKAKHDGSGRQGDIRGDFPQQFISNLSTKVASKRGEHGYDGLPCKTGRGSGCFVNLRLGANKANGFNQPSVYASTSQSLAILGRTKNDTGPAPSKVPWQLNDDGEVTWKAGGDSSVLKLIPTGSGYAVSKAKVYFHQLGDWSVPPNSFDPFWRAKLHPFAKNELKEALEKAGDTQGAMLAGHAEVPVEGSVGPF